MKPLQPDFTAFLAGRKFVAPSGNTARIQRLENAAFRVNWQHRESEHDRRSFDAWVQSLLPDAELTVCDDERLEAAMLRDWKKKVRSE